MLDVGKITKAVASNSIVLPMQTKSNEEASRPAASPKPHCIRAWWPQYVIDGIFLHYYTEGILEGLI
jgi:hypothetical protein